MSDLINIVILDAAPAIQFKDLRLNEATQRILAIYDDAKKYADEKNREIACILSDVKKEKSYEADGFKSVADYAEATFGIKKANAYALANAGTVYNNPETPDIIKELTPSKVAEIATMKRTDVQKAIEDGSISLDSTQKELREVAKKYSGESGKKDVVKVLPLYTLRLVGNQARDVLYSWWSANYRDDEAKDLERREFLMGSNTLPNWIDLLKYYINESVAHGVHIETEDISKAYDGNGKRTLLRTLFMTDSFCVVAEFKKWVQPKVTVTPKAKPGVMKDLNTLSLDELRRLLAEKEAEAERAYEAAEDIVGSDPATTVDSTEDLSGDSKEAISSTFQFAADRKPSITEKLQTGSRKRRSSSRKPAN